MRSNYKGTTEESEIFFHYANGEAKEMFFYPICIGHYFCDNSYIVDRESYDSFLILYVHSGEGYIEIDNKKYQITKNMIVFIDCYKKHKYYTDTEWEISWIHFDGVQARKYFDSCTKKSNIISLRNNFIFERTLVKMFNDYKGGAEFNDAILSKYIVDLLTEIYTSVTGVYLEEKNIDIIEDTIAYIAENACNQITIDELAERVAFSKFYFMRIFKKATGITVHECILQVRVDIAKFLLKSTTSPIKEISFKSGFNSESSFCTAFKNITGITPSEYRAK